MAGNNVAIHQDAIAETVFVKNAAALEIDVILDIGANTGQFAEKIRALGFNGLIFSVEPQLTCRPELIERARYDLRWIVLPNQGAGSKKGQFALNISMNNHSSSFYDVHENHLKAEPTTKTVAREWVSVSRTDQLLPHSLTARVGAIKIDTQGFELEILKGLSEKFKSLRLLQVELSAVECYVGAPDLSTVDNYIQNELGFERIGLEPTYIDETTGTVQQYDGIYLKRGETQVEHPQSGISVDAVVTSVYGEYKRIGDDGKNYGRNWLSSCVNSWKRLAPNVVSISEMKPEVQDIDWIETKSKPRLVEVFQKISNVTSGHVVLTNSDILLTDALAAVFPKLEPDILYYGNRIDVNVDPNNPTELVARNYFEHGYDFFIIPPSLTRLINTERSFPPFFRFGEPWWDYALPLYALQNGFVIKNLRLEQPAAVHFHHVNLSNTWLREQGLLFLNWCHSMSKQKGTPAEGLLQSLAPLAEIANQDRDFNFTKVTNINTSWLA